MLETFPDEGASFTFRNVTVIVREVDERRVTSVEIRLDGEQE